MPDSSPVLVPNTKRVSGVVEPQDRQELLLGYARVSVLVAARERGERLNILGWTLSAKDRIGSSGRAFSLRASQVVVYRIVYMISKTFKSVWKTGTGGNELNGHV